jgi:hypothetical protein
MLNSLADLFSGLVNEDANLFDVLWQLRHNLPRHLRLNLSRTLLVKHEPQSVGACVDCYLSILEIRDSANFDPSHRQEEDKTQFSDFGSQFSDGST